MSHCSEAQQMDDDTDGEIFSDSDIDDNTEKTEDDNVEKANEDSAEKANEDGVEKVDMEAEVDEKSASKSNKKKKKKAHHKKKHKKESYHKNKGTKTDKKHKHRHKRHSSESVRSSGSKRRRGEVSEDKHTRSRSRSKSRDSTKKGQPLSPKSRSPSSRHKKRKRHKTKSRSRSRSTHRRRSQRSHSKSSRSRSRSYSRKRHRDKHSRSRSGSHSTRQRQSNRDRRDVKRPVVGYRESRFGGYNHNRYRQDYAKDRKRYSSRSEDDRYRGRSRSPEEDRLNIDKAKLREIAIRNAYANMQTGIGPKLAIKVEELVAVKSGGKSVAELTDFCKKIVEKGGGSDSDNEKYSEIDSLLFGSNARTAHDIASEIILSVKNSKPVEILTPQAKLAKTAVLRSQFPVSSGSDHRAKESEVVQNVTSASSTTASSSSTQTVTANSSTTTVSQSSQLATDRPAMPVNMAGLIVQRLEAIQRLKMNPMDMEAHFMLNLIDQKLNQNSAAVQQSVGLMDIMHHQQGIMPPDPKRQAWARKDIFTRAAPISGGIGKTLLEKMGWKEGEGLGKNNDGSIMPIMPLIKVDRKGLAATTNQQKYQPACNQLQAVNNNITGKHPVSALMELCSKRKWNLPIFTLVDSHGPSHIPDFKFKVFVNGIEYEPARRSATKKAAKVEAAVLCLHQMGYYSNAQVAQLTGR